MLARLNTLARLWWPRRIAAVLAVVVLAWSLRTLGIDVGWVIAAGVVQLVATIGLWFRQRWAWTTTLTLQTAPPLLSLLVSARGVTETGWWLQQLPHLGVVVLLLLPEGRHARAALREPGFEPGDTTPV